MNAQSPAAEKAEPAREIPKPALVPHEVVIRPKRRRFGLMLSLPVILLAGAAVYWVNGGQAEVTDNANLHQARINVASDLGGRIVSVGVADGKMVTRGAVMFQVDPEPYRLALLQADIGVAAARLQVAQLKGAYAAVVAQDKVAEDDSKFLTEELNRQLELSTRGVGTVTALDTARNAARRAGEQANLARVSVDNAKAALGGDPDIDTDRHPAVQAALAAQEQAQYRLDLTEVKAPTDGLIYQATSFKPGQFVTAGAALFTLLPAGDLWIDANFKETQLAHIKPGAVAKVTFDVDTSQSLDCAVDAIGAGTGSEFSLLPAQNATGNWVKVTQRVPVRVRCDAIGPDVVSGMSASVSVATGVARRWSDLVPAFLTGQ